MQVDSAFSFQQPTFEDFLNMDLLAGSSSGNPGSSSGSSRSSSHSPSSTHAALPPTPPNPFIPDIAIGDFYNFDDYMTTDLSKLTSLAPPPTVAAPFDIFNTSSTSFGSTTLQSSSPDSGSGGSNSNGESPGIDPSLVGTPALSKSMSEFDFDEEEEENDDFNDLEAIPENSPTEEGGSPITPIKVGGKGKSARKGTVQSGGVVKKSASAALKDKKENQPTYLTTTSVEPDDWRPTPEEYKKMSSKEKRQLRNKISARNFRVRRKEYISTLEGDIAERDRLIDHIRTELLGTKSENSALRQEIAALKKALLEGRDAPNLPPPAPLPSSSNSHSKTPKSPLLTPNTHKDLPTSPRLGRSPFWGGISGFGGGITPVHTTIVPEWSSILSGKPPTAGGNAERRTSLQENINPTLNSVTASTIAGFNMGLTQPKEQNQKQQEKAQLPLPHTFESFADKNMFTYKSMEDFRMQLWTRMGQQQALLRQQQQAAPTPQSPAPALNGLASNMRPHYFKTNASLAGLLSGKAAANAYPSPPPSPPRTFATPSSLNASASTSQSTPSEQQAMLASIASQTLVRKLGSAFWDAFSGSSASSSSSSSHLRKDWDADKVRKVLEGKAVVRIVDVEPTQSHSSKPTSAPASSPSPSPSLSPKMSSVAEKKGCNDCFSILEKGIRNMHL